MMYVALTYDHRIVEAGPALETDKPVSKQYEGELRKHYTTSGFGAGVPAVYDSVDETKERDSHLRSAREVVSYHIGATDGDKGHVEDFILGSDPWALRYLVVDTRNWLPGRKFHVNAGSKTTVGVPKSAAPEDTGRTVLEKKLRRPPSPRHQRICRRANT